MGIWAVAGRLTSTSPGRNSLFRPAETLQKHSGSGGLGGLKGRTGLHGVGVGDEVG